MHQSIVKIRYLKLKNALGYTMIIPKLVCVLCLSTHQLILKLKLNGNYGASSTILFCSSHFVGRESISERTMYEAFLFFSLEILYYYCYQKITIIRYILYLTLDRVYFKSLNNEVFFIDTNNFIFISVYL